MNASRVSSEYVAARKVLLDVLEILEPHREALILIGAQAVYHNAPIGWSAPSYTTDADLALDAALLAAEPISQLNWKMPDSGVQRMVIPGIGLHLRVFRLI